jgi:hypothetical protein
MQRVSRSSAVPSLPAPPASPGAPGFFTGGNPGLGQGATVPGYEWFNAVQEELIAVIAGAGLTPNGTDLAQLRKAMDRAYAGNQNFYAGNVTLTPDQAGLVYVDAGSGPRVITLPLANSCNGKPIRFFIVKTEGSANSITIQPSAGDGIDIGTPNVSLGVGESVELISNGVTGWYTSLGMRPTTLRRGMPRFATAAEVDAGTLSDVAVTPASLGIATRNYANPGYARLPGGLILQWGQTNALDVTAGGTNVTATFPIAFPNAVLNAQGTGRTSAAGQFSIVDAVATLTGVTFSLNEWTTNVQNASVAYLAIGR